MSSLGITSDVSFYVSLHNKYLNLIAYRDIKQLESYESTQINKVASKSQDDRPSSEIPHESRANLLVPVRVCNVEFGEVCCKNNIFALIGVYARESYNYVQS